MFVLRYTLGYVIRVGEDGMVYLGGLDVAKKFDSIREANDYREHKPSIWNTTVHPVAPADLRRPNVLIAGT